MNISKLVEAAIIIVLLVAAAGKLPRFVQTVRVAQLQLLRDSHFQCFFFLHDNPNLRFRSPGLLVYLDWRLPLERSMGDLFILLGGGIKIS